jgi:rhodanese-related sulfurtransferase/DNA-binding transcriptional ArsR family regulator
MTEATLTAALYEQFARIGKGVDSPKRIELLELLAQGPKSVDQLAAETGMGVGNTSAHLQVLRQARLVDNQKRGARVVYRLADDLVARFLIVLKELARARLAEVEQLLADLMRHEPGLEVVARDELSKRLASGQVIVIDVRPREEYAAGHIRGAISLPIDDIGNAVNVLPRDVQIVAYCRGPYCIYALKAVSLLQQHGYRAAQLEAGFPEWRLAGLPIEASTV